MSDITGTRRPGEEKPSVPKRRGYRAGRWLALVAAGGVIAYALSIPVLQFGGRQLVHIDALERSEVMLVLASGLDRVIEAADLYRLGYSPLIILTEPPREPSEQYLLDRGIAVELNEVRRKRILEALGVPSVAIVILPDLVDSTADEARAFARWAQDRPIRSVMIVTSAHHTGRSRLTFQHTLRDLPITVYVRPSGLIKFDPDNWWRSRDTLRIGIIELQKLLYYRLFEL